MYFFLFVFIQQFSAKPKSPVSTYVEKPRQTESGFVVLFPIRVRNRKIENCVIWTCIKNSRYMQVQKIIFWLDEYQGGSINNKCPTFSINEIAYIWVNKVKQNKHISMIKAKSYWKNLQSGWSSSLTPKSNELETYSQYFFNSREHNFKNL
jgi:hypothetical protein